MPISVFPVPNRFRFLSPKQELNRVFFGDERRGGERTSLLLRPQWNWFLRNGTQSYWQVSFIVPVLTTLGFGGCGISDVYYNAKQAVAEWQNRTDELDQCRIDAMQHCVGGSAAAAECGPACAVLLGELLELGQKDGNAMDLHNNEVGATRCQLPVLVPQEAVTGPSGAVACCELLLNQISSPLELREPCN